MLYERNRGLFCNQRYRAILSRSCSSDTGSRKIASIFQTRFLDFDMPRKRKHLASSYDDLVHELIRDEIEPGKLLARIIAEKLGEKNVDTVDYMPAIQGAVSQILAAIERQDDIFEVKFGDEALDSLEIVLDADDVGHAGDEVVYGIEAKVQAILARLAESALRSLLKDPARRLLHLSNDRDAFVRRLELTWSKPFELLDVFLSVTGEIGEARNDWLRRKYRRSKDFPVIDVITRLHGRAITVAAEVRSLLHSGFADGALSRWRTLHELAVTALFISEKGEDVAKRYAAHITADSIKAAKQYKKFAAQLGYRPISKVEQTRLDNEEKALVKRFGAPFLTDYGWSADALNNAKPNFSHIEAAVSLDRLRPYFKQASNTVHAGAKGTYHRLGVMFDHQVILAGASNAGLEEAGRLVPLSLNQITMALLMLRVNADSTVWGKVLGTLSEQVEREFLRTKRRLEREELGMGSNNNQRR